MKPKNERLATLSLLILSAALPAAAQFEISPDHFDGPAQVSTSASAQNVDSASAQIAEQEALLRDCKAQISAKQSQVDADWRAAISTWPGDEAGQMIAFTIHQKELEQLKASLAPRIKDAMDTLAKLEKDSNNVARAVPVHARESRKVSHAAKRTLVASR
jgi:hypothetical protein